jgi:3-dehydroquinate synthase
MEYISSIGFSAQRIKMTQIVVGSLVQQVQLLNNLAPYSKAFILCDTNTHQFCLPKLHSVWPVSQSFPTHAIPAGEVYKQLDTCAVVWQKMTDLELDRDSVLIVLGGGVVGDLGGFCAATYKRGIRCVYLPTTLLSMLDSSVGAKVGVDFQGFKNLIGCFSPPELVLMDPDFLSTLPDEQLLSGFAEAIKHAAIGDRKMLKEFLERSSLKSVDWASLIPRNIMVKARIVRKDPYETHLRRLLNFGHTVGHALESHYLNRDTPISHGHAVALGMLIESRLIEPRPAWVLALQQVICKHFSLEPLQECTVEQLWPYMLQDKKKAGNAVRVALPGKRLFTLAEHIWEHPGQIRNVYNS